MILRTLSDAIDHFEQIRKKFPERDGLEAEQAACAGTRRRHAALRIGHLLDPLDRSRAECRFTPPPTDFPDTTEGRLARQVLAMAQPLELLNPIHAVFPLGHSPADLIPSFGIPLSEDRGAPAHTCPLETLLQRQTPHPERDGLMPEFKAIIEQIKDCTPDSFKISMPNLQGPFNLAHAILGDEAFTAPLTDFEAYDCFMRRLTAYWMDACGLLMEWIGPDRLRPLDRLVQIAECSVNMVTEKFYADFILPYDLLIAERFGRLRIHPCSGRHVFRATLQHLPVAASEAGLMLAKMAAPCIGPGEALRMIGDRPVTLTIGQELPADWDAAFDLIRRDLDRYAESPRLLYSYTGMLWRNAARPRICDLHRRLDQYWDHHIAADGKPLAPADRTKRLFSDCADS
jgi:hypothetical protein